MEKLVKKILFRHGGYEAARKIHYFLATRKLERRIGRFQETGRLPLPDSAMFELTQRCNLNCRMCYQDRKALTEKSEIEGREIGSFFQENSFLKKVTLYGGEIFLRKDLLDIVRSLGPGRNIILPSNGTLVGERHVEELKRLDSVSTMCISLDGPADIHDAIRGRSGTFRKAAEAARSLAPVIPVTVTSVIQNDNIEVLPKMVDFCASLGVRKVKYEMERLYGEERMGRTIRSVGLHEGETAVLMKGRTRDYSLETLRRVLDECLRKGKERGVYVTFEPPYLMEELESCYHNDLRRKYRCFCRGFSMATIAPDGDVIHCYVIRKSFGNIGKRSLTNIWNSPEAARFRLDLLEQNLTPICENCGFMTLGARQ